MGTKVIKLTDKTEVHKFPNQQTKHPPQSPLTMAEALPQFKNIEEINAEDSSSKLEEYLCSSLDDGAKSAKVK